MEVMFLRDAAGDESGQEAAARHRSPSRLPPMQTAQRDPFILHPRIACRYSDQKLSNGPESKCIVRYPNSITTVILNL